MPPQLWAFPLLETMHRSPLPVYYFETLCAPKWLFNCTCHSALRGCEEFILPLWRACVPPAVAWAILSSAAASFRPVLLQCPRLRNSGGSDPEVYAMVLSAVELPGWRHLRCPDPAAHNFWRTPSTAPTLPGNPVSTYCTFSMQDGITHYLCVASPPPAKH